MGGIDFYTRFIAGFVFPLHEYLKGHTSVNVRRDLEASQWWSRERLDAYRLDRLRRLLEHARTYVPYYRDLFERLGIDPGHLVDLRDLSLLPLLDKANIRANRDTMRSLVARKLVSLQTGGSSGEPLSFLVGTERVSHDVAAKWRATRWWGVDIGSPEVVLWGSPIELGAQDFVRRCRDRLLRTQLLPAFEMSEARLERFVSEICRRRPHMLFGYPSALALMAKFAERRGVDLTGVGVKVAFVTSEQLDDGQREQISRVFRCPVANGYGGRDAGFIAHECPSGGMHITAEDIIVEVIDEHGHSVADGVSGEIVVTHLATLDFPFIRYRTGDIGVLSAKQCSCGRGLPLLQAVKGRITDLVVTSDGTTMHGLSLIYVLRETPGVSAFKVIQWDLVHTTVQLVREEGYPVDGDASIRDRLKARLGQDVEIEIQHLPTIPPEKSGKFRHVVSHVEANVLAQSASGLHA